MNPVRLDHAFDDANRGDKNLPLKWNMPIGADLALFAPVRAPRGDAAGFPRLSSSENPSFQIYFPSERTTIHRKREFHTF